MSALVITTNYGIEQDELTVPVKALRDAGIDVTIAAVSTDDIRTLVGDEKPGESVTPDTTLDDVDPSAFDLLVVPGGTINADQLRLEATALNIARAFARDGKTIAAICHAPWLLVEADLTRGKTLTSFASIATDVRNSGATWVDEELVTDEADGWTLITSRSPEDLPAFTGAITSIG
ncbi:type 1 glutamine amidotransferase domain-containing protein [Labedella endophytica]|uniref:Type 1 glutamine amidotransferase n=1 Tax=Labedella endophytica TaxID=1523160 RepID=A0A3S0X0W7_9MICO|nr:type 1 glutamine amidotransferase domain-containing protein [Labedella endophytica]RUR03299.1 type 1 glutamine amidotransferase [Labedella endophytica]